MGNCFITNREMTRPRDSSISFGEISYEQLQSMSAELNEEEKSSPFAFHYYEPMADIPIQCQTTIEGPPINPKDCYMPWDIGKALITPNADIVENGYGIMPNGIGFAAIKIEQSGITDEMIRKYRDEFAQAPATLFYKLWFPGAHILHYTDGVVEDFGWGIMNVEMGREEFELEHLRISREEIITRDPHSLSLVGLCGRGWEVAHPENDAMYISMIQHTRETDYGRELRVRYWSGFTFAPGGELIYSINPDHEQTLVRMRTIMEHCMREYYNELRLMKCFLETGK